MIRFQFFILIIFSILTTGCSRKIEGEAIYKTNLGLLKTAGMPIYLWDPIEFNRHIKDQSIRLDQEVRKMEENIKDRTESVNRIIASRDKVIQERNRMLEVQGATIGLSIDSISEFIQQYQFKKTLDNSDTPLLLADQHIEKSFKEISELLNDLKILKSGRNGEFFFPPIDQKTLVAKTDVNGKFSFEIKEEGPHILLARSGSRHWIIKINDDEKRIVLNNANESTRACELCVLN